MVYALLSHFLRKEFGQVFSRLFNTFFEFSLIPSDLDVKSKWAICQSVAPEIDLKEPKIESWGESLNCHRRKRGSAMAIFPFFFSADTE